MCVGALSTCMSVHPMLVAPEKNLELESQTVERYHVGAEKWTQALRKSSQYC